MKDAVATMGGLLPDDVGGRDAVHVAVISTVAGEKLSPGQDVGLAGLQGVENIALASATVHLGIVDPFLKATVWPGQRFWLYLYPRTITGLHHQWTHPAFPDAAPGEVYAPPSQRLESEKWMREFSEGHGVTCDRMIEAARNWVEHGEWFIQGGTFEGVRTPEEFWEHYERITGTVVSTDDRDNFFSCSC